MRNQSPLGKITSIKINTWYWIQYWVSHIHVQNSREEIVVPFLWTKKCERINRSFRFQPGFEPGPAWPLLCCSSALPTELRGHTLKFKRICCTIVTCAKIVLIQNSTSIIHKEIIRRKNKKEKRKLQLKSWKLSGFNRDSNPELHDRSFVAQPLYRLSYTAIH